MKPLAVSLMILVTQCACDRSTQRGLPLPRPSPAVVPAPSPPPTLPPAPPPVPTRAIAVGEEVTGTFTGASHTFELTATASGTLVARLAWGPSPTGSLLALKLANRKFDPTPPDWSPVVGRMPVAGGQRYSVVVEGFGTDEWFDDPFVLKTWME